MIYKKEIIFFEKEIINYSKQKGICVDFTYGNGYHSNILKKKNILISYDIDIKIKKKSNKNFFFFNKCYSNFLRLKTKKITIAILDFGYNLNQIKNFFSYKKNFSLEQFSVLSKKSLVNFFNFESEFQIKKKIKKFGNLNFLNNKLTKIRKKKLIKTTKQIKNILKKKKKKRNNFSNFFNFLKNLNLNKNKINSFLIYTSNLIKKRGFFILLTYNSLESKIFKNFYKKIFKNFFYRKIKKKNYILRILKKK
ncbi:16S rRNA (cytosine(1402)-N(4))-methyltransferase [Candidatus Vidania fulgoroideorum]